MVDYTLFYIYTTIIGHTVDKTALYTANKLVQMQLRKQLGGVNCDAKHNDYALPLIIIQDTLQVLVQILI